MTPPIEPEAPTDPSAGVRPALRAIRKRRRQRIVLASAACGILVAGFGVGAAIALGGSNDAQGSEPLASGPTTTTTTKAEIVSRRECRSPLSGEDPLRLWIAGDSLAGSLGPSLGELTGDTGVVQPVFDSRISSGLASPEFFDWPEHGTEEIARLDPEVVVFIIGANDWTAPRRSSDEWKAGYARYVEDMIGVLTSGDRRLIWIGSPPMEEDRKDEGVRGVNAVMQEVIAKHPDVTYVDAYKLFAGPDGEYASSLTLANGEKVRVRGADGVHFTPEGGDLLGENVYGLIDAQCDVRKQAIVGAPKQVIETEGSSEIPGTRRPPTTAGPTAAAPTTRPPTVITQPTTTTTTTTTTAPPPVTLPLP